jgi:hypothetical protein
VTVLGGPYPYGLCLSLGGGWDVDARANDGDFMLLLAQEGNLF